MHFYDSNEGELDRLHTAMINVIQATTASPLS